MEGRTAPSVALAFYGAEESKGTPMLREAHQLLKATPGIRFVGNIEPRAVPNGDVDVVDCDGNTGNDIHKVLMVGGSSRIPAGQDAIKSILG